MEIIKTTEEYNTQYVVIKMGKNNGEWDQILSTDHSSKNPTMIHAKRQISDTQNVGIQENFYFHGFLTEKKNYEKISPMEFSLDIYNKPELGAPELKRH